MEKNIQRMSVVEMKEFADAHSQDVCWPVPINGPEKPKPAFRYRKGGSLKPAELSDASKLTRSRFKDVVRELRNARKFICLQ